MRKLMEYRIISGAVMEVRRTWLPSRDCDTIKKRGIRIAGNSSEKKIRQNEQEAIKQLARLLNANLEKNWMLVTVKYDDAHLPTERAALKKSIAKYLKAVRAAFKAEHGRTPRYLAVNGTWSVKNERPARWHHHIVIEACSRDLLAELWHGGGSVICEDIDNRQDHTALAVYLYRNTERAERGECRWSTSRGNLAKPIYTEPVEVSDGVEGIQPLPNSTLMDMTRLDNEDGKPISAYIRCVLPARPKVRGGQVILPKPPKRGGRKGG